MKQNPLTSYQCSYSPTFLVSVDFSKISKGMSALWSRADKVRPKKVKGVVV